MHEAWQPLRGVDPTGVNQGEKRGRGRFEICLIVGNECQVLQPVLMFHNILSMYDHHCLGSTTLVWAAGVGNASCRCFAKADEGEGEGEGLRFEAANPATSHNDSLEQFDEHPAMHIPRVTTA